jgi:hypothetical protein
MLMFLAGRYGRLKCMHAQEENGVPAEAAASSAGGAAQQAEASKKAAKRARQRAEKAAAAAAANKASDAPTGTAEHGAALNPQASSGDVVKHGGAGKAEAGDAVEIAAELLRMVRVADERCATSVQEQKRQKQKRVK